MLKFFCYLLCLLLVTTVEVNGQASPRAYPKNTVTKPSPKTKQPVNQTSTVKNTGDTSGYTATEKKAFLAQCIKSSKMSQQKGSTYCSCMLAKLMRLYPNMTEMNNKVTNEKITELAKECLALQQEPVSKWTATDRSQFITKCEETATEKIGQAKAKTYCGCMLAKIETAYPVPADAAKLTTAQINKWAEACNEQ